MSKFLLILLMAAVSFAADSVSKTAIDLMNEGRFQEARTILDSTPASSRYRDLLDALTETNAIKACGMYLHIAENHPDSDCDSVAQERLQFALDMGIDVEAVREEILMSRAPEQVPPVDYKPITNPEVTEPVQMSAVTEPAAEERVQPNSAETATLTEPVKNETIADMKQEIIQPNAVESAIAEPVQTSGMTIDYDIAKKDESKPEEVVHANATPEKVIVDKPKSHAVEVKNERIEAQTPVQTQVVEPVKVETKAPEKIETEAKTPEKVETTAPVKIENEQLAVLETKTEKPVVPVEKTAAGVKPLSDPNTPHDLETDASANGEWYVQVGAFGNHDNAHRLAAKIRSAGYRVILVPRETNGSELMQVRVGGYFTIEESRAVAGKLKTDFSVPASVVNK